MLRETGSSEMRQEECRRTVSPAANIRELQLLYRRYLKARKHKAANMVHMRLRELMHRQLKRENREDRRA